jgi:hypothetical protein
MNEHRFTLFIRSIHKCASTLILLHYLDEPTGETEVARILGISVSNARVLLASLELLGLVVRTGRYNGYQLSREARSLGLINPTDEIFRYPSIIINDLNNESESQKILKKEGEGLRAKNINKWGATAKKSRFERRAERSGESEDEDQPEPKGRKGQKSEPLTWKGIPKDLAEAFREARLVPNDRIRALAKKKHITPAYVRAQYLDLVERGHGTQTGFLVHALESNLPARELNENGHLKDCRCHDCDTIGGGYRGWVTNV